MNLDENDTLKLAQLYKIISSTTRVKIISELANGALCVNEIASRTNMTQSAISHHLKELRQSRIVKFIKKGQSVLYSLQDNHILKILSSGAEHIKGEHCDE